MRLLGQFQACLFFLRTVFERAVFERDKTLTSKNQPTKQN